MAGNHDTAPGKLLGAAAPHSALRMTLLVTCVLLTGLDLEWTRRSSGGMEITKLDAQLPGLGILVFGIITIVCVHRIIDAMPGVFALRRPLGRVRSGYGYLWVPAVLICGVKWSHRGAPSGAGDARDQLVVTYGLADRPGFALGLIGTFALMMVSLKLLAAMREANRRLQITDAF